MIIIDNMFKSIYSTVNTNCEFDMKSLISVLLLLFTNFTTGAYLAENRKK